LDAAFALEIVAEVFGEVSLALGVFDRLSVDFLLRTHARLPKEVEHAADYGIGLAAIGASD